MAPDRHHHQAVLHVQVYPKTDFFVQGQHTLTRKNHANNNYHIWAVNFLHEYSTKKRRSAACEGGRKESCHYLYVVLELCPRDVCLGFAIFQEAWWSFSLHRWLMRCHRCLKHLTDKIIVVGYHLTQSCSMFVNAQHQINL